MQDQAAFLSYLCQNLS